MPLPDVSRHKKYMEIRFENQILENSVGVSFHFMRQLLVANQQLLKMSSKFCFQAYFTIAEQFATLNTKR